MNNNKFIVEVAISQTFTTQVVVEGDYQDKQDPAIYETAKRKADNMNHDDWDYENTEFEMKNITPVPDDFSSFHHDLLHAGLTVNMIKDYSEEDAEAELGAIRDSL